MSSRRGRNVCGESFYSESCHSCRLVSRILFHFQLIHGSQSTNFTCTTATTRATKWLDYHFHNHQCLPLDSVTMRDHERREDTVEAALESTENGVGETGIKMQGVSKHNRITTCDQSDLEFTPSAIFWMRVPRHAGEPRS